jgi:BirA family transcriptional regulator, biotin operon repressor / biotin---[acetyl-CoA-carboxylase] ligase
MGAMPAANRGAVNLAPRPSLQVPPFVRHVEIHDELPSTNDRAMQLTLFAALETPALIVARRQLAGRGRGGHSWWSSGGALTFSLVLEPAAWDIAIAQWPRLSLTTAVAVCDALEAGDKEQGAGSVGVPLSPCTLLLAPCSIKWPNDVLIDGKKVAGILLESPGGAAPAKDRLVVGVGINLNNSWRGAPHEAGTNGVALCDVFGSDLDLNSLLSAFLEAFDFRLHQLGRNDPGLPSAWQQLSWLTGHEVEVSNDGRTLSGKCLGIADDGALLVQTPTATERIYSGSVHPLT